MNEAQQVSELIGDIYDAALDPTLWPSVLEAYARFVGGSASALFIKDSVRKTQNNVYTWGYDPNYTRVYLEKYVRLDPFTTGQFFFDVEESVSVADILPHSEFRRSRFYAEWVRPQRWIDALGVTLEKSATTYAVLSVIRHEGDGIVDDGARRRAKLIAPHARRAVLIGKVIELQKVEAAALADTLDGLAAAMFLVDANGRIVHANAAGHIMLADNSVIGAAGGKLATVDARVERTLHDVFMKAAGGDAAVGVKGIAVPLRSDESGHWVAHILPLTAGARRVAGTSYSATAAVFVRRAAFDAPHPLEALANLYKLTPTEMRVLMGIVEIGGVPEIAPVLGISETTVKTHLYHVFEKTGAKRQVDLVKLVASFMSPLG